MTKTKPSTWAPGELLFEAFTQVIAQLDLSADQVEAMVGCSQRNLREALSKEEYSFVEKPAKHAIYLVRIFLGLGRLYNHDTVNMRNWMHSHNTSLDAKPIICLSREHQFERVANYLETSLSR